MNANRDKVGNEFGSVEALWSQFENFMGRSEEEGKDAGSAPREEGAHDESEGERHSS